MGGEGQRKEPFFCKHTLFKAEEVMLFAAMRAPGFDLVLHVICGSTQWWV